MYFKSRNTEEFKGDFLQINRRPIENSRNMQFDLMRNRRGFTGALKIFQVSLMKPIAVPNNVYNRSFLYLKPDANTLSAQSLVRDWLHSKACRITSEGQIDGQPLLAKFERQFREIERKSLYTTPRDYTMTAPALIRFQKAFGMGWSEALQRGLLMNAAECLNLLDTNAGALLEMWLAFYNRGYGAHLDSTLWCVKLELTSERKTILCINGFYPSLKLQYESPGASVHYFTVDWEDSLMTYQEFRTQVIGSSDPWTAPEQSLRRIMLTEWRDLGFSDCPTLYNNCIHDSASAFEAFAEISYWLDEPWMGDPLGSKLYSLGLTPSVVEDWINNAPFRGKKIFDHMENLGCQSCLDLIKELFSIAQGKSFNPLNFYLMLSVVVHTYPRRKFRSLPPSAIKSRNHAFIYIKPASNIPGVVSLVRDVFLSKGFVIAGEGDISSYTIKQKKLAARQYANICKMAQDLTPRELELSAAAYIRFQKKFHLAWCDALAVERVYNARDCALALHISHSELMKLWLESIYHGNMVKFGRGCYCARLVDPSDASLIYCINGFYPHMQASYEALDTFAHYFHIEWVPELMSWDTFRRRIIGSTNPVTAHPESLRYLVYADWQILGLPLQPNMENNAIHSSASAYEAMVERGIWLNLPTELDPLGTRLHREGIPSTTLDSWAQNPRIMGKDAFEYFEDKGNDESFDIFCNLYNVLNPRDDDSLQLPSHPSHSEATADRAIGSPIRLPPLRISGKLFIYH
jgi:nucleoside diphosphate kinase